MTYPWQSWLSQHDKCRLVALTWEVRAKTNELRAAIGAAIPSPYPKGASVPQVIDDVIAAVQAEQTVVDSAIALIGGIQAKIDAAVAAALANGATAAQLAPLSDLAASVKAETQKLADAVAAINPPSPPSP